MPTGQHEYEMFRPCQVSTRNDVNQPRENSFLSSTAYDRTRPHKSASLTISPAKSTLSLRPEANKIPETQTPRRPQSAAPRSELWHPGPTGQSPDRCSAPPRLRIIPHGPRPSGLALLPSPSASSRREEPIRPPPRAPEIRSARASPIRNPSSDLQGSDGGAAPRLLTRRGTRARRPWRAVAGAGAAPRWI